jgi:SagB-type dehydrogenase family enzyme
MSSFEWDLIATPLAVEDASWELFHENSKLTPHDQSMPEAVANAYVAQMPESLTFEGYLEVTLPDAAALPPVSLRDAMARNTITPDLEPCRLSLESSAALLRCAYGAPDGEEPTVCLRRRRSVYSAGSLFPLELFVHIVRVAGLEPGLYHYFPPGNSLRLLRKGDYSQKFAAGFLDPRPVQAAAMTVFIAAMPERSVFRYGDRGYRFVLLEAGAVVQNLNLAAAALGLGCANAGEFFDSEVDEVLDFDGLSISTLYAVGIGNRSGYADNAASNAALGNESQQRTTKE